MRRTRQTSLALAVVALGAVPIAAEARGVRPGDATVKTSPFKGSWDGGRGSSGRGGGPSWGWGKGGGQSFWKHASDWRGPGHGHSGRGHFWHGKGKGHGHHPGDDDDPCSP